MKKYLLLLLLVLASATRSYADDVTLTIDAPATTVQGAQIQLRYILRGGNASDIQIGSNTIKGFEILYGPTTSSFQQYSNINGKVTNDSYVAYTYILLAQEAGTHTLPSATVKVGGHSYTSKSAQIKVLPPDKNAQPTRPGQQPQAITSSSTGEVNPNDAFVKAVFSKTKVNEQEAVMVTFRFYTVLEIRNVGKIQFPEFEGFMAEEVELPYNRQWKMEHYNGRNYMVMDVKKTLLFPQRSGKMSIPGGMMDITFDVKSGRKSTTFFGQQVDIMTEARKTLRTKPVVVDVSALPTENKPILFSGAVGSFSFKPSISTQHIKANEAVTLKIEISGTGNMKLIKNPAIKFPEEFETYDPKVDNDKLKVTENGLSGTKTIEYMFIPRQAGKYTIPPIEFNYYDSQSRSYKTLSSPAYEMTIDKDPNAGKNSGTSYNQKEVEVMKDIHYIKDGEYRFARADQFIFGSLANILWYVLPLILFIGLSVVYRQQIKANANVALTKTRKANKVAIKRLKQANKYLQANNKDSFYEEVLRATWGYLSDKLTIPVADLNRENIELELNRYGVEDELIKQFIAILDTCEFARYAPSAVHDAMDKLYSETVEVIGKMENVVKI